MSAPGFNFKGLQVSQTEDVGLTQEYEVDERSGRRYRPEGDYRGSTLYSWKTDRQDPAWQGGGLKEQVQKRLKNSDSVNVMTASIYLFGCCFYNCFFCCFPGSWCGRDFCFPSLICCEIKLRRDRWLWGLHFVCFCIHLAWAIAAYTAGMDSDMLVTIYRIKPSWENRGGGYGYAVVPADNQFIHIHILTALFFGFSAFMHGIWVFISPWSWSKRLLWNKLDDCLCWWRWAEYSFSASLMFVGIAVTTAIRDQNTLAGIAFLSFSTMWCGYFTELLSRPSLKEDGSYDYDKWAGDPDPPEPLEEGADWKAMDDHKKAWRSYTFTRWKNYSWRMFPHVLGVFPYTTAWVIILNNFFEQINDLCEGLRDRMPDFVPFVIYGSALIFSLFTFVQWRYQFTAPKHYWRTEVWYCVLSATSKIYLGYILYINVIAKSSFNEAVSLAGDNYTAFNITEWC